MIQIQRLHSGADLRIGVQAGPQPSGKRPVTVVVIGDDINQITLDVRHCRLVLYARYIDLYPGTDVLEHTEGLPVRPEPRITLHMGDDRLKTLVQKLLQLAVQPDGLSRHGELDQGVPSSDGDGLHLDLGPQIQLRSQNHPDSDLRGIFLCQCEVLPDVLHLRLHRGVEEMGREDQGVDSGLPVLKQKRPVQVSGLNSVIDVEKKM